MITWINTVAASWWNYMAPASLQSALFFLGILGLSILFRNRSATFLHLLWFTVIVKALLPPVIRIIPLDIPSTIPGSILQFTMSNPHTNAGAVTGITLSGVLFIIWSVVTTGALGVFLRKNYSLSRYLRQHRTEPEFLPKMSPGFRSIPIFTVPGIRTPLTHGILRPAIYLPETAEKWRQVKRIMVLRHEAAHIARKDTWLGLLQTVTQILFFFHPGIWIANRQVSLYRELACDDRALIASGLTWRDYGEVLLSFFTPCPGKNALVDGHSVNAAGQAGDEAAVSLPHGTQGGTHAFITNRRKTGLGGDHGRGAVLVLSERPTRESGSQHPIH